MKGMRSELIPRWYSSLGNKKIILESLRNLLPDIKPNKRGQPPKQPIRDYFLVIVLKESKKGSLRDAETDWSEYVCGRRIDHSVIGYWEKTIPREVIDDAVRTIGSKLEELLGYNFSVIDATTFSNWYMDPTSFHLLNRIHDGTVYPVSVCLDTLDPVPNTKDTIVKGEGFFMGDKWYDVNKVYGIIYKHGYVPLISPQRTRCRGYWRREANEVYNKERITYRQRGRGESIFGSLTNEFGDRLNTRLKETTYIRSVARVISYQIKIYIRATCNGVSVIWVNS